ncbi:MAG TPA: iron uptake transporter deferrochelatase/peroxidase subunit [Stellaceae bacterium]|nr:iron uptake transporter deferrochelatase/peroxidase subunit [Stellaceae bacterium]
MPCPFGFGRPPAAPASEAPETNAGGTNRRNVLFGLGAGGGALLASLPGREAQAAPAASGLPGVGQTATAENANQRQPFYGRYQSGIVNPRPQFGLTVAFDSLATSRPDLEKLFRLLTTRIAFLTQGGTVEQIDPKFPPLDSGLLGPTVVPRNLTVTMSLGASLFDDRYGLAHSKPKHLMAMQQFPNDELESGLCGGDILLQICSDTSDVNIHALRDIVKQTSALLAVRWKMEGFLPNPNDPSTKNETARNFLGFKDGTANPPSSDAQLMHELVWVKPGNDEPGWAENGSYQAVRLIRMFVERWDRTPLQEQETIFGRAKTSGAPLGYQNETDIPDYAADPRGLKVPLTAHMRLANPRTKEAMATRILRRPFNYSRGADKAGQLDMGLLFICYQADLAKGFIAAQTRLNGEPLEEYIKPFGGGYFFAVPGVQDKDHYLGQGLIESISA